jgi:signal peptidase
MRRVLKDVLMGLAGIAGLISIIWLVASALFGVQLVVFKTGSMSPSMPTGTAALANPISAAQIAVGDVLMVQREGSALPVTHRVVSVEQDPDVEEGRIIVMRGDDNDVNDQFPYRVTEAHRVFFSVPGLGALLASARTPLFLGGTTLAVAALVIWAFWPGKRDESDADHPVDDTGGHDTAVLTTIEELLEAERVPAGANPWHRGGS